MFFYVFTLYREWEKVVKKVNIYDWTPLFYAIKLKKVSMVKCLLNHGAGIVIL